MRVLSGLAAAAVLASGLTLLGVPAATPAAADECEEIGAVDADVEGEEGEGSPIADLQIRAAHDWLRARGRGLGKGVRVGVVDSGVSQRAPVAVADRFSEYDSKREPGSPDLFPRGTAVAGLVAGDPAGEELVGIAPQATVYDIAVYDAEDVGEEQEEDDTPLETESVVAGLRRAATLPLDIVVVALEVEGDPALREAVRDLTTEGVVVVAASGDVPLEGSPFAEEFESVQDGDDAAQEIFPAGYAAGERPDPLVVAATSTVPDGGDPREFVLPSSATTVAVPTASGVSYAVNGVRCTLGRASSKWAAGTVGGVLALLASAYPRETGAQLVARLVETSAGPATPSGPNGSRFLGRGVVQPLEALSREVDPREDGTVPRLEQPATADEPAAVDPPPADPLASAREDAVWWALGFGGLITVLLLLRPVIGRRSEQ